MADSEFVGFGFANEYTAFCCCSAGGQLEKEVIFGIKPCILHSPIDPHRQYVEWIVTGFWT
jgi:hypothetical protein